ncbi:MAG: 50S ribosomal protein L23 [Candidatus Aenigmatarchaeota archaeon]|nr:MAG: 50S ribosomal protein L23 [Candidatus Aenigmarchaeota archaeon]
MKKRDTWDILLFPHRAEKSVNMIEKENKIVFIVRRNAKKSEIKEAVEKEFKVKVSKVRTEITRKGQKKAYIKLSPEYNAMDIAIKLGMM